MSSLREMLESRRASESAPSHTCHGTEAQPACLIVTTNAGESWVFPWTHLACAHLTNTAEPHRLCLTFTSHEVRISGHNLQVLRDLIAHLELARVHPAPGKYHLRGDTEAFIESIQIVDAGANGEKAGR